MSNLRIILLLFRALFRDRSQRALENLALRQQAERAFWGSLARAWDQWRSALILVKLETVIRRHRQGCGCFWRWKSRDRPSVSPEVIRPIRRMSQENPLWGAPRIHSELLLLGNDVAEAPVAWYMTRRGRRPPNHLRTTTACDFFILSHDRRRILHFNVTAHPTAEWIAQQPPKRREVVIAPRRVVRIDRNSDRDASGLDRMTPHRKRWELGLA